VKLRQRQRGQLMLIILGTLFLGSGVATGVFVSGKSIKSIRKEVSALQLEAERQAQVYRVLEQWEAIAEPATDELRGYARELMDLISGHDQQLMLRQREEFREAEDRLLPLREELRATLDKDEWDQLFR
jgi:hypothetical protein